MKLFLAKLVDVFFITVLLFYIVYIAKPYFFSKISPYSQLGFNTVIIEDRNLTFNDYSKAILKGEVIKESFTADENNLGVMLIKFNTFGKINKDIIRFRIKEEGSKEWYYQRDYSVDQFQNNTYFTFGFLPIANSKGNTYLIEIESLKGKKNDAVAISSHAPQLATAHRMKLESLREKMRFFQYKIVYTLNNISPQEYWNIVILLATIVFWRFTFEIGRFAKKKILIPRNIIKPFWDCRLKALLGPIVVKYVLNKKGQTPGSGRHLVIVFTCLLLFTLAFLLRYSEYLNYKQLEGPLLFTSTIGAGSDQDSQTKCAQDFVLSKHTTTTYITHPDYLIMCPYMGYVIEKFGFVKGLEFLMYSTMIMGALVAVVPFILLSYLHKRFSIGGLFASLVLIVNQLLIYDSSGRFMIYPLSTLFFTFMYIFFFLALYQKKLTWLIGLGITAGINGLNKPFFLFNDIPLLALFSIIYLVSDFKRKKIFPFFNIKVSLTKRNILYALLPLIILFSIAISFELYHYENFDSGAYLGDTFFPKEKTETLSNLVLGNSLLFDGPITTKIKNIVILLFKGARETIVLSGIHPLYALASLLLIIFNKKNSLKLGLATLIVSLIVTVLVYFVSQSFLANSIYVPLFVDWTVMDYLNLTLFVVLFIFIFFRSIFTASAISLKLFYLFALSMTLSAVNQQQLFVTLVIWVALCFGLALESVFQNLTSFIRPRVYFFIAGLIFLSFLPGISLRTIGLVSRQRQAQNEWKYLTWAGDTIPKDGFIIGGASDNLIWLSKYTKKTVVYSGFYVASIIPPNAGVADIKEFPLPDGIPGYVQKVVEEEPNKNNLYILDENIPRWAEWLENGWSSTYPKNKYALTEYATDPNSLRKIYKLKMNPNYIHPKL